MAESIPASDGANPKLPPHWGDLPGYGQPADPRKLDGTEFWYKGGVLHRDNDLPAITHANGMHCWYQHGKRHRDGDKPAVICPDGTKAWWNHNVRYRIEDGTGHRVE